MVRKIYENAIYLRKKQNTRKVYQRSNNVLPIEVPGAGDENINPDDENINLDDENINPDDENINPDDETGEQTQQNGTDE